MDMSFRTFFFCLGGKKRFKAKQKKRKISKDQKSVSRRKRKIFVVVFFFCFFELEIPRPHPLASLTHQTTTSSDISVSYFLLFLIFVSFVYILQVNKRFVTSYLNVQGKLYTKIG